MGTLIGFLIEKGLPEKWARLVLTAGLFLVVLGSLAGIIALYNHHIIAANNAKIEARAKPATDQAASERASDTIASSKQEQELHNVIQVQPDQPIAPTSHALACQRLRNAGRNPPACR